MWLVAAFLELCQQAIQKSFKSTDSESDYRVEQLF